MDDVCTDAVRAMRTDVKGREKERSLLQTVMLDFVAAVKIVGM